MALRSCGPSKSCECAGRIRGGGRGAQYSLGTMMSTVPCASSGRLPRSVRRPEWSSGLKYAPGTYIGSQRTEHHRGERHKRTLGLGTTEVTNPPLAAHGPYAPRIDISSTLCTSRRAFRAQIDDGDGSFLWALLSKRLYNESQRDFAQRGKVVG